MCQERGRPVVLNPTTEQEIEDTVDAIADRCEEEVKQVIERNMSGGPPLSDGWAWYKEEMWGHRVRWFDPAGKMQLGYPRPGYARSGYHKNVFTGTLHDSIESWRTGWKDMRVRVGIRHNRTNPVTGISVALLAVKIEKGIDMPQRPFLTVPDYHAILREEIVDLVTRI